MITIGVEALKEIENEPPKWIPLLGKILSLCVEQDVMYTADDEETTGIKYRQNQIRSLCMKKWNPEHILAMVSLFCDVTNFNAEELELIFQRIRVDMKQLEPDQIPPLVYQVLRLTNEYPAWMLKMLFYLSKYFSKEVDDQSEDLMNPGNYENGENSTKNLSKIEYKSIKIEHKSTTNQSKSNTNRSEIDYKSNKVDYKSIKNLSKSKIYKKSIRNLLSKSTF